MMDIGRFVRQLLLRFIYMLRGERVYLNMFELQEVEKNSVSKFRSYQNARLGALLAYARKNTEYYKTIKAFDSNVSIDNIYKELLCVDKYELIPNLTSLTNNSIKQHFRSTSGTTGSPFSFPKDIVATAYMDAIMYIAYSWHGVKICDKQARLWGRPIKKRDRIFQNIKDIVFNRKRLSAFDMDKASCTSFFEVLIKFKPKFFYAYSNSLYQFAIFVEECPYDGKSLGIEVAICTGEVLYPFQREKIEAVFGCRVVNEYGSTENGIIGFECECGSMHVMPTVLIDIVNVDEDGVGEIVVTELNSRSIPFIKYKIGDRGRVLPNKCECSRPYDILEVVEGRVDGYIRCRNGRLVYDAILAYTLKNYATRFKAYQITEDLLKIILVPGQGYSVSSESEISKILKKYLGDEMVIEIVEAAEIPSEASGKFRYFIPMTNHN